MPEEGSGFVLTRKGGVLATSLGGKRERDLRRRKKKELRGGVELRGSFLLEDRGTSSAMEGERGGHSSHRREDGLKEP